MFPELESGETRHLGSRNLQCRCPRTEEECHVYHDDPHHHTRVDPHWCLTDVALQLGVGLLPERRSRLDRAHRHHPGSDGTPLRGEGTQFRWCPPPVPVALVAVLHPCRVERRAPAALIVARELEVAACRDT